MKIILDWFLKGMVYYLVVHNSWNLTKENDCPMSLLVERSTCLRATTCTENWLHRNPRPVTVAFIWAIPVASGKHKSRLSATLPGQNGKDGTCSMYLYKLETLEVAKAMKIVHWEVGYVPEMCNRHLPKASPNEQQHIWIFNLLLPSDC